MHISGDVQKICFLKKFQKIPRKNVFSRLCLKQSGLSNLLPMTILKTDSTASVSAESPKNLRNCWEGLESLIIEIKEEVFSIL